MPTGPGWTGDLGRDRELVGRRREREALNSLVDAVRGGESRVLVLRGEPGVGKTALLEHIRARAVGCRVVGAAGVQAEMELPFAGLHQLIAPMLDRAGRLPAPQRGALLTAFGISSGRPPDRLLVGLAVLSLLSDVAEEEPLCCFIDDVQWLDRASVQVLALVGRRLGAESVGMVFASRTPSEQLAGLPELVIEGLTEREAVMLLDSVLTAPLDARVRDRVVAETGGNPLALLELFRGLTAADLAGGFGLPSAVPVATSIEEEFRARLDALPAETRTLLLVAAADPVGEPALVWRGAFSLGVTPGAALPATEAGLVQIGTTVRFRHPLVRSAAYRSAPAEDRLVAHRALSEATDPTADPDRRAWHRAQGTPGPDEDVAEELERSAGRAQARGGLAAAAAFLERASALTPDAGRRAQRALAAAHAKVQTGAFTGALQLLAAAEAGPLGEVDRARVDLVRAQLAFATNRGSDASPLLLNAALRLEHVDLPLARATYLDALIAALFAGRLASPEADLLGVARAAAALPAPPAPTAADLLLEGLARNFTDGYTAGLPVLRAALTAFGDDLPADQQLRWLSLAYAAAMHIWDDEWSETIATRWANLVRDLGALSELALALTAPIMELTFKGELAGAARLVEEVRAASDATGNTLYPHGPMALVAFRGSEAVAAPLIRGAISDARLRGEGFVISSAEWATAVLNNGLGRYEEALAAAQRASGGVWELGFSNWALVELVEAAAHIGAPETAAGAYSRLAEMTEASGTDWALGIQARSHALLAEGDQAEALHCEAIERLGRTRVRPELARAHLLYGEWLRRQNRRVDARGQLRTAHEILSAMGIEGFAERARRELLATGETVRKRTVDTATELTAQEACVARLVVDGLSNPEIGARLFISPRTVQYHLRKVFQKLEVTSRSQLHRALPDD